MSESIIIDHNLSKEERYQSLIPQVASLVQGEKSRIANLANAAAALKQAFDFLWVGFYLVEGEELVLGPFQGPVACTRINRGSGVCGTAWAQKQPVVVPDVDLFPGHIACSPDSRSEIVIPIMQDGEVVMVLDVDSKERNDFDPIDQEYLGKICELLIPRHP